jgi:hypothetical protein
VDFLQKEAVRLAQDSDFFFQEAILDFVARRGRPFSYFKKDYLFSDGTWRGAHVAPVSPSDFRAVVVIGHSDYELATSDALRLAAAALPRAIFASNLTVSPLVRKVFGADYLPLGLSNPTRESPKHEIFGDWSLVRDVALEAVAPQPPERARLYANFDPRTAPKHRQQVAAVCEELDHVEVGTIEVSKSGRLAYLRAMRDAGLVVCPRGNGPDTHRFYEALYVGAIPVVLKSSYAAQMASRLRLPHLTVAKWSALNDLAALRLRAARLRSQPCSLQWIRKSAWLERLENLVT